MIELMTQYLEGSAWKHNMSWVKSYPDSDGSGPRRFNVSVHWIFLTVGIAALATSAHLAYTTNRFLGRAVDVPGKVVQMVERTGRRRTSKTYGPLVEFADREGRVRTFQSKQSSNPPSFFAGEVVTVLYDPNDPSEPKIRTLGELWALTLLALAFGVVFTGFPLAFWFAPKRRRKYLSTS